MEGFHQQFPACRGPYYQFFSQKEIITPQVFAFSACHAIMRFGPPSGQDGRPSGTKKIQMQLYPHITQILTSNHNPFAIVTFQRSQYIQNIIISICNMVTGKFLITYLGCPRKISLLYSLSLLLITTKNSGRNMRSNHTLNFLLDQKLFEC